MTTAAVHGALPEPHKPPTPPPAGIYKYVHTHSFLIQTPNESLRQWDKATSGHKAEATAFLKTELLYFEFLGLVELLSDTVLFVNLHHFLGIYAIFLGN